MTNRSSFSGMDSGLFTDLYELTMAQAYHAEGMRERATFSLFYRSLPASRNYILACGSEHVAEYLETIRFSADDIAYLREQGLFSEDFLGYLADFRFTGDLHAVPDGTPVFPQEPLVEVCAPIAEAQIMETWVMNQMHAQSVLASKAARVASAARGRQVLDFGLRRIHGADGGLKAARAFYVAGVTATSNVLAGRLYGVPIAGTMAHSYVQAHDSERAAFRAFMAEFPETVLLVDTYDTLAGVRNVIALAHELGDAFAARGVRIDSGDLAKLARQSRQLLDENGLESLKIFVSGGIDEFEIESLLESGAPIDGFGVGTAMGVSEDAPALDIAYKLVEYGGLGRMKLSTGKESLPGAKQVYRLHRGGRAHEDVIARRDERIDGVPLLEPYLRDGRSVRTRESLEQTRERARTALAALPDEIRSLRKHEAGYPVRLSRALEEHREAVRRRVREMAADTPI